MAKTNVTVCVCVCVYIYIYIYIYCRKENTQTTLSSRQDCFVTNSLFREFYVYLHASTLMTKQ